MNALKPHLRTTIQTLLDKGATQREIERFTGVDRKTIRRYQRLSNSPGVATGSEALPDQIPRVRHRRRALRVRREAKDHRRDRRSGRDREAPHAPGSARPCAAARTGAGGFARPRNLGRKHNNGSAAESTDSLGLRLRSTLNARRNDAARDDSEAKNSSSPTEPPRILPHDRAIDRSMQGRCRTGWRGRCLEKPIRRRRFAELAIQT